MPAAYLKDLTEYWTTTYDWRAAEKRLNRHSRLIKTRPPPPRRAGRCQPSVLRATPATVQVLSGRWAASGLSGRHWRR
ncbi:epoxide hydrolase N-terminal domain-containing protein [Streptosporangium canum]|uniref:epoxide hydrolase N-terminal domain-containing protein n=1 Tax=Streptosporangium canum TaxID=324952 RepID=UPI0037920774